MTVRSTPPCSISWAVITTPSSGKIVDFCAEEHFLAGGDDELVLFFDDGAGFSDHFFDAVDAFGYAFQRASVEVIGKVSLVSLGVNIFTFSPVFTFFKHDFLFVQIGL